MRFTALLLHHETSTVIGNFDGQHDASRYSVDFPRPVDENDGRGSAAGLKQITLINNHCAVARISENINGLNIVIIRFIRSNEYSVNLRIIGAYRFYCTAPGAGAKSAKINTPHK